jgi:hypothetical protein
MVVLVMCAVGYGLAADSGLEVSGGTSLRTWLDRFGVTVFRVVRTDAEIRGVAAEAREPLIDRIHKEWLSGAWIGDNRARPVGNRLAISPWISSQAMCAAFRAINAQDPRLPDFLAALDVPFGTKTALIEADGRKFGWMVGDADYTQAEPALWTLAATAVALGRKDLLNESQRRHVLSRLRYVEEVTELYGPADDGGWNIFARQENLADHSTYTTTLALLAMLEMQHANLGWRGDKAELDRRIRKTSQWLIGQFQENPKGWRGASRENEKVLDGLTLQVYSELLRAEEEVGVSLPETILEAIPRHLDQTLRRSTDFPQERAGYTRTFTNFDGRYLSRLQTVNVLWHPWAIDTADRWLRRLEQKNASPEAKVQARRVLDYLVVDLGKRAFSEMARDSTVDTFVASETLYVLSTPAGSGF